MNLQFFHSRNTVKYNGCTVACLLPSKESLMSLLNSPERKIMISIGASRCSLKDNFSKKIGRELASQRLNLHEFKLTNAHFNDDKIFLILENVDPSAKVVEILVRIYKNSPTVHFIDSTFTY